MGGDLTPPLAIQGSNQTGTQIISFIVYESEKSETFADAYLRQYMQAMRYLFHTLLILFCFNPMVSAQRSDPLLWHYRQAEAFANQQRFDEALREYRNALQLDANFAQAHSGIGMVYWKMGRIDDAIDALQKALALNGDILQAHAVMGILLSQRGQDEEAITHYKKAIELDPKSPHAYLGLGNTYHAQFKFNLALKTYTQALELKLQSPEIYCNRGIIYTKQGEYDKALTDLQQALTIDTGHTPARFELGFVYQQMNEYEKAVREYERVIPHRTGDLALHHNLARCYLRLGQVEAARHQHEIAQQIREFQDALNVAQQKIREKPDNPDGYMALAKFYAEYNQPDKAFEQYKTAILKDASLMEAYDAIAALYIRHQQSRKAVTVYKTAVGVDSGYIKGHLMLGLLYQQHDQPKESTHHLEIARQLAQKATETMPNVQSLNMLGAIHLAMKDYNVAEAIFQKALKLAPDNKQTQELPPSSAPDEKE